MAFDKTVAPAVLRLFREGSFPLRKEHPFLKGEAPNPGHQAGNCVAAYAQERSPS